MVERAWRVSWLVLALMALPVRSEAAGLWRTDEKAAREEASRRGVPLLVEFKADWCGLCRELDRHVFSSEKVRRRLAAFVPLAVDVTRKRPSDGEILARYGVRGLPALVVLSPDGKILETLYYNQVRTPGMLVRALNRLLRRARAGE